MFFKREPIQKNDLDRLIDGCLAEKRSCQKELYDLFSPKMLPLCLRYSKNQQEAEEILQDGFLRMFRNIGQYKHAGPFEGWLRRIMINCALMRYRSTDSITLVIPLTEAHHYMPSPDDFLGRMSEQDLIQLIQQLPPTYRLVFNLYVFEGLKHREIAHLLNISEGTSKSNLSDARTILRKNLTPQFRAAK
jgi:RNA polymerase sigma-70 factor (ECF subfamily)